MPKKKSDFSDLKGQKKRRRKLYTQKFERGCVDYFTDGTADVYADERGKEKLIGHQKWRTG